MSRIKTAQNAHSAERPDGPPWRAHALAGAVTLLGFILAVRMAVRSDGVYHDDDACHYNIAVDAWTSPVAMWTWWGRPGYNLPAAVVAHFWGLLGCRIFSAVQTAVAAYLAFLIARRVLAGMGGGQDFAALAPALVWVQPLTTTLAITTLTETPALLYLTLATWLFMSGRQVWACLAMGLCFVTRYETVPLGAVFMLAAVVDQARSTGWKVLPVLQAWRLWACAGAMALFPLLYVAAAELANIPPSDSPLFLIRGKMTDEYGTGTWGTFLFNWVLAAGPGVLVMAGVGAMLFLRRGWLPAALCATLVAVHSYLFHEGIGATGGYPRFLVPLSGLTAALAAAGLAGMARRGARGYAPALAMLLLGVVMHGVFIHRSDALSFGIDVLAWRAGFECPALDPAWLHAGVMGGVGILATAAVLLAASRREWALRSAVMVAFLPLLALVAAYALCEVRPLRLDASPVHATLARAVRYVERSPHAKSPAVTCHVILPILTGRRCVVMPAAEALRYWESSPPGTLFYRDSRWCPVSGTEQEPDQRGAVLERSGRLVYSVRSGWEWVDVFVRTSGQEEARLATTAPASGEGRPGGGAVEPQGGVAEEPPLR